MATIKAEFKSELFLYSPEFIFTVKASSLAIVFDMQSHASPRLAFISSIDKRSLNESLPGYNSEEHPEIHNDTTVTTGIKNANGLNKLLLFIIYN